MTNTRPSSEWLDVAEERRAKIGDQVFPIGISYFDEYTEGVFPTDLILVGADTGVGKTTLITMIAERAARIGKRPLVFALEAEQGEIEQRTLYQELAEEVFSRRHPRRAELRYARWKANRCEWASELVPAVRERVRSRLAGMSTYYRTRAFTADDVAREIQANQSNADLFILDHVHYIDFEDPNENRAIKEITKTLRDVVLCVEKPVICVAHLRKPDRRSPRIVPLISDFMGSSDLPKIATKCVLLSLADPQEGPSHMSTTYMHVVKDRNASRCQFIAEMQLDIRTWKYSNNYALARLSPNGQDRDLLAPDELPEWAKSAIRIKPEQL